MRTIIDNFFQVVVWLLFMTTIVLTLIMTAGLLFAASGYLWSWGLELWRG